MRQNFFDKRADMFQDFTLTEAELEGFPGRLEALLERQKEAIEALAATETDDYEAILKPLEEMDEERSLLFTPLSPLN
jgi:hypothetical protein